MNFLKTNFLLSSEIYNSNFSWKSAEHKGLVHTLDSSDAIRDVDFDQWLLDFLTDLSWIIGETVKVF